MSGKVFIIGAGPGDPGLLTVRADGILRTAPVVFADGGVSPEVLQIPPTSAEKIVTGARPGRPGMSEQAVIDQMIDRARSGQSIVRLLGGDPYLFSTGGREAIACRAAGIDVEVVPGVSSVTAAPAYAGIPILQSGIAGSLLVIPAHALRKARPPERVEPADGEEKRGGIVVHKHRGESGSSSQSGEIRIRSESSAGTLVEMSDAHSTIQALVPLNESNMAETVGSPPEDETGPQWTPAAGWDGDDAWEEVAIDWKAACAAADTLVILMPTGSLDPIREGLLFGGRPASEPVAAIRWGTTSRQKTVVSTVGEFPEAMRAKALRPPTLLVVGDVVTMRQHLNLFEEQPLFGWRVAVTRHESGASDVVRQLRSLGAAVLHLPTSFTTPIAGISDLVSGFQDDIRSASHLVFCAPPAVEFLFEAARSAGLDARLIPESIHLVAVGEETAEALTERGLRCSEVKEGFSTAEMTAIFGHSAKKARALVLGVSGQQHRLADSLVAAGVNTTNVPLYDTKPSSVGILELRLALTRGELDAVVFHTHWAVAGLVENWGEVTTQRLLAEVVVASVGAETKEALARAQVRVDVDVASHIPEKLARSLARFRAMKAG